MGNLDKVFRTADPSDRQRTLNWFKVHLQTNDIIEFCRQSGCTEAKTNEFLRMLYPDFGPDCTWRSLRDLYSGWFKGSEPSVPKWFQVLKNAFLAYVSSSHLQALRCSSTVSIESSCIGGTKAASIATLEIHFLEK